MGHGQSIQASSTTLILRKRGPHPTIDRDDQREQGNGGGQLPANTFRQRRSLEQMGFDFVEGGFWGISGEFLNKFDPLSIGFIFQGIMELFKKSASHSFVAEGRSIRIFSTIFHIRWEFPKFFLVSRQLSMFYTLE